ncbi:MAG: hypothetical protein U9R15_10030 [Chloroflexota bacterium]|nr:hypothetical protein [Chloroflexota bacterium]
MKSSPVSRITHHVSRITFYALLLLTIAWSPTPQSGEFPVTGQVINGTPDGTVPLDLPVVLHTFSGMEETDVHTFSEMDETGVYTTTLTSDGSFHFDGLAPEEGDTFTARVVYQGVVYASDFVTLKPEQQEISLPVTIYETTENPADIQITQAHLFITGDGDCIQVGEYYLIGNTGERTYTGVKDPKMERPTTLRFTLPEDAERLKFDGPGLGERFLESEDGFSDTEPIPPGDVTTEVFFSYEFTYREGMLVERAFDAPVASIVILLSDEGLEMKGEGIIPGDSMNTQMGPALSYTAGPLAAGETLAFRLVERAAEGQESRGTREQEGGGGVAIGLVSLAAAVAIVYWLWQSPASGPAPAQARPLVEKIAALDVDFEAGKVTEKTYHKKRKALKRQVRANLLKE